MSLKNLFFVTFIVFLVHTGDLNAQQTDQKKLEAKRKALKEEINKIKTYIDKTQKGNQSQHTSSGSESKNHYSSATHQHHR